MKSNFKRNLLIGFSVSMIILLFSSVASFVSITNLLTSAGLVTHTNDVIVQLKEISAAMIDAETGQRGYLIAGEDEFLAPYKDARERAFGAFDKVKVLTRDNDRQQQKLPALRRLMEGRFRYLETAIENKNAGVAPNLGSLRLGREAMDEIRRELADMEDHELSLLGTRTESMNRFARITPPLILGAAAIALIITVVFYARVSSDYNEKVHLQGVLEQKDADISNRINIIQDIADKISQGSYSIRVDDKQSDSLGSLAGSLNKMAESLDYSFSLLSDKEWLQTGLTNLNNVIIGEKEIETLSAEVIASIASYTDANAGAVYLLDGNELRRTGGYAFSIEKSRDIINAGEGVLGQAVVSRKPIELKDIPDNAVTISFATGAARPRHVIAVPIMDGYTIKGVMELATVGQFTQKQIDYLTHAAPNIGIAISTSQNRRRMQELLEETQAQSEELRTQHTELENLNSELEMQAEKLQASEEELKVQQEELKQANEELEERSRLLEEKNHMISERNIEIQTKADQLAQTTRYKSDFLANMSHELRTPLNSILLLSRLMSENPEKNLNTDQLEYARVIQTSGQGLLSLIDEILDLSKIEAGKMKLEYQDVSLKELAHNMNSMFAPLAREKKIEFKTNIADDVPDKVETDKLRVEQVIRNLISNAVKFTANGYVMLNIERRGASHVALIVKDTGIGIPLEKQSIVFEAFQQADGSTRRKYGGTGLGLSISRELVKLLGGEISLTSEPDKGSEFTLMLPIYRDASVSEDYEQPALALTTDEKKYAAPAATAKVARTEKPAESKATADKKYLSTTIPENIPDDRVEIVRGDKVILIIEDDTSFAKALLEFTRKKGYKGVVSVRGDEGIELAKQFLPVGILLDLQLPIRSGWDVMDELKANPETRHIPVHIMSSHEVKTESLTKGAVDFINKPVAFEQMQEIFSKIEYVLKNHPKKVLIVEENERHAKALAYFLETFDVNLEIKNDVAGAIESLKSNNVDCVILDMGIPDKDAYDTLDSIKKTPGLENLPIIIFTGKSLSQPEVMKIRQYADSIVVKTAYSYKRILDEVSLFLHLMEKSKNDPQPPRYHKLGALDEVLKNKTVLVADDDMRNIFSLTKALEKYQMNVVAAVDGKDALKKLKASPKVDIVLMDMMMPEMDGYETTTAIRKERKYKDLPIIAVTAKAMMGDREKCIAAGASDYITKPVDVDQLFSLLRVWLYESGR